MWSILKFYEYIWLLIMNNFWCEYPTIFDNYKIHWKISLFYWDYDAIFYKKPKNSTINRKNGNNSSNLKSRVKNWNFSKKFGINHFSEKNGSRHDSVCEYINFSPNIFLTVTTNQTSLSIFLNYSEFFYWNAFFPSGNR